jgi:hypothetical protein
MVGARGASTSGAGTRGGKDKTAASEIDQSPKARQKRKVAASKTEVVDFNNIPSPESTELLSGSSKKGTTQSPMTRQKRKAAASKTGVVDINNEDYNIPSLESTELLAGSSKKGTTNSPKTRRRGKAANNEDYNIPSPERTKLLTEIKSVIGNVPVSPALWACCQLADMHRLKALTKWEGGRDSC